MLYSSFSVLPKYGLLLCMQCPASHPVFLASPECCPVPNVQLLLNVLLQVPECCYINNVQLPIQCSSSSPEFCSLSNVQLLSVDPGQRHQMSNNLLTTRVLLCPRPGPGRPVYERSDKKHQSTVWDNLFNPSTVHQLQSRKVRKMVTSVVDSIGRVRRQYSGENSKTVPSVRVQGSFQC